jgi:hypothetical protein
LTLKKNDKFLEIVKKIEDAESYKEQYFTKRAKESVSLYSGYWNSEAQQDPDKIPNNANLTYSTTRTIVSSIYAKNPSFTLLIHKDLSDFLDNLKLQGISLSKEAVQTALEFSLKILISEMSMHRVNRLCITDAVVQGFGVTKLGYKYELDREKADSFTSASSFEISEVIKTNRPYIVRVNPQNIILPIEATDPTHAEWVCEKIYMTAERAKEIYKKDLKAEYVPTYTGKREKNDMVCVYEYHDFANDTVITYANREKLEEKVYPLVDEYGNPKSLYNFIWFNDSLNEIVYPTSDIDLVKTQIKEANSQIERRINFNRKNTPKFFLKGSWNDNAKHELRTGEDLTIIDNETGDGSIDYIAVQTLGAEFYNGITLLKSEIYEILGLTDYQVGGSTQERKATEAQLIDRSRLDRVGERVRLIEDFFYSQVDTLVELIKAYQDVARVIKLEYEGKSLEISLDKELYNTADLDITVVPGSTVSIDQYQQDALLTQDIQMAALAPQFINAGELLRQYYQKRGYTNLDKIIPSQQGFQADFAQMPGTQGQVGQPSTTPLEQGKLPDVNISPV